MEINTVMRTSEFISESRYRCRAHQGSTILHYVVLASTPAQAVRIMRDALGDVRVVSIDEILPVSEASKTTDPADAHIDYLNRRAKELRQRAKLNRAKQSVTKAQKQLSKSISPK
jgi:hypothetical protein